MAGKEKSVPTKVFVGNVPQNLTKEELRDMCEGYGAVEECDVIKNFAFVHFSSASDAANAVAGLNGKSVRDRFLRAEISKSTVRQKPGMGNKDGCYRCGGEGHWSKDCPTGSYRPRGGRGGREGGGGGGYRGYSRRDPYYDDYEPSYYPPRYEERGYDDYYRRRYPPVDYYGGYRERTPYSRPAPEYYSRGRPASDYYSFGEER